MSQGTLRTGHVKLLAQESWGGGHPLHSVPGPPYPGLVWLPPFHMHLAREMRQCPWGQVRRPRGQQPAADAKTRLAGDGRSRRRLPGGPGRRCPFLLGREAQMGFSRQGTEGASMGQETPGTASCWKALTRGISASAGIGILACCTTRVGPQFAVRPAHGQTSCAALGRSRPG